MHQVSLITLLNGFANSILAISALHLTFKVFGTKGSPIWSKPLAAALCKLATTVTICGAISNILTFSTPAWTELVLNIGVSLNFLWISFYFSRPASTKERIFIEQKVDKTVRQKRRRNSITKKIN